MLTMLVFLDRMYRAVKDDWILTDWMWIVNIKSSYNDVEDPLFISILFPVRQYGGCTGANVSHSSSKQVMVMMKLKKNESKGASRKQYRGNVATLSVTVGTGNAVTSKQPQSSKSACASFQSYVRVL